MNAIQIAPQPPWRATTHVTTLGEQLFDQGQDTHSFKRTFSPSATAAALAVRRADRSHPWPRTPEQGTTRGHAQEWRQRDSSGISKASHTARQIVFGSVPSARAWSTVRPPRPPST